MQAAAVNQQRSHSSREPPKFNCITQENGWYWLSKFIAYCRRAGIDIADDDTMLENFTLSIGGSAETWFMLLPHDQRDTHSRICRMPFVNVMIIRKIIAIKQIHSVRESSSKMNQLQYILMK